MAATAAGNDPDIVRRIHAVRQRPENGVGVQRIDVLAQGDDDLAALGLQGRCALDPSPDFLPRRSRAETQENHRSQVGQGLVHGDAQDPPDLQLIPQMCQEQRLVGDFLEHAGLAGRDLTDDGGEHRRAFPGDRGDLHRHVEVFQCHVAVTFPEGTFGLESFGVDQAFHDDLRIGRHFQVYRHSPGDTDRSTADPPGNGHLILSHGQLLRTAVGNRRRRANGNGARHELATRTILLPVQVAARSTDPRRHAHAETIIRLQRRPIRTHVANTRVRVAGDDQRRHEVGSRVVTRRRDRHGECVEAAARLGQCLALNDDLLAGRRIHAHRWDRILHGVQPPGADLLHCHTHAHGVDLRRRRQGAHGDGHRVRLPPGAGDAGKEKCRALRLPESTLKLPPNQRMQFSVLVDGPIDSTQQTARFQADQVFLEVRITGVALTHRITPMGGLLSANARSTTTTAGVACELDDPRYRSRVAYC